MKVPPLTIGELTLKVPIIQGGMGIGVSRANLASAVSKEGALGVISGVQIGFLESDFYVNTKEANLRALKREIKKAKDMSNNGIIGVNLMHAMKYYDEMVIEAAKAGADVIISGAGLPTHLPELVSDYKTELAPIVSSKKATSVLLKLWDKKYSFCPSLIIVEGPLAGGHLGFKEEELIEDKYKPLSLILGEVIEAVRPYEAKYNKKISIVVGGGIYTREDVKKYLKLGADGVQLGTRFVTTHECDAHINYKKAYLNCEKEDIKIIKSPVGMPGRAINNNFIKAVTNEKEDIKKCFSCLRGCNPKEIPYCITKALIEAVLGNTEKGLIFIGSKGYKSEKIISVKELIDELIGDES